MTLVELVALTLLLGQSRMVLAITFALGLVVGLLIGRRWS